eukprot:TRINITY_DN24362_c0_g1_i1.p1 TRINITY_DN24362_c0_g1~~TRINITY_DN24362_c0_g1_i1.p1  ORF type:complete len:403 (-),score=52.42 TRINITY_DN24362_c0_g1_i1:125-1333(-)
MSDLTLLSDPQIIPTMLAASLSAALLAYCICSHYIPSTKDVLKARGIYGIDINKISQEEMAVFRKQRAAHKIDESRFTLVPESLGLVVGGVYLLTVCLSILSLRLLAPAHLVPLAEYNAALSSIGFMLLLGFVDDVLDVRWRYKIVLSLVGTIPLLVAYSGATNVLLPLPVRPWLGRTVELGALYYIYMGLICVFTTNGINILAGVNGIEVGQTLVIAYAVVVHNTIELFGSSAPAHFSSLVITLPFLGAAAALWKFNQYPSRVFVGDSFTYFAGMVLAVAGVSGHFTKTLMLFFIPQLINFALSLPQLFGLVPCPRHRVPRFDPSDGLLHVSKSSERPGATMNLTLLNLILRVFGPMTEPRLTVVTLVFQALCCAMGFLLRYRVAQWFYDPSDHAQATLRT